MITELDCKSLGGVEGNSEPMADGNYISVYDNRFRGRDSQKVFIGENLTSDQLKTFLDLVGAK